VFFKTPAQMHADEEGDWAIDDEREATGKRMHARMGVWQKDRLAGR